MLKGFTALLIVIFIFGCYIGLSWGGSQQEDPFFENFEKELENGKNLSGIPVYFGNTQRIGSLKYTKIDGKSVEYLYYKDTLIAFGQGEFLSTSLVSSQELMKRTLKQRYGDSAQLLEQRLIMINPLKYIIQGSYNYQGKIIDDLIYQCHSGIFTLRKFFEPETEGSKIANPKFSSLEYWQTSHPLPVYQFYLSDFSTCLVMLANYWKTMGWIKTQLHPDNERYFIVNLHLMIQDVEMLRRKCQCDDDPKSIGEIIKSFLRARGSDVNIEIWESNSQEQITFNQFKELFRRIDQPCLMELSSNEKNGVYAVLKGYAQIPQGEFLECVFPTPYLGEKTYQRYFFRWDEVGKSLKIYYIMNPSGSEDV